MKRYIIHKTWFMYYADISGEELVTVNEISVKDIKGIRIGQAVQLLFANGDGIYAMSVGKIGRYGYGGYAGGRCNI